MFMQVSCRSVSEGGLLPNHLHQDVHRGRASNPLVGA